MPASPQVPVLAEDREYNVGTAWVMPRCSAFQIIRGRSFPARGSHLQRCGLVLGIASASRHRSTTAVAADTTRLGRFLWMVRSLRQSESREWRPIRRARNPQPMPTRWSPPETGSPPPLARANSQTRPLRGTSQSRTENVIWKVLGMVTSGVLHCQKGGALHFHSIRSQGSTPQRWRR
jgi:hypothetical protein